MLYNIMEKKKIDIKKSLEDFQELKQEELELLIKKKGNWHEELEYELN